MLFPTSSIKLLFIFNILSYFKFIIPFIFVILFLPNRISQSYRNPYNQDMSDMLFDDRVKNFRLFILFIPFSYLMLLFLAFIDLSQDIEVRDRKDYSLLLLISIVSRLYNLLRYCSYLIRFDERLISLRFVNVQRKGQRVVISVDSNNRFFIYFQQFLTKNKRPAFFYGSVGFK